MSELSGNRIRDLESDAANLIRKHIRVIAYRRDGIGAVLFVNAIGARAVDADRGEEHEDIADAALPLPAPKNELERPLAQSAHLQQTPRLFIDDAQQIRAEMLHQPRRHLFPDAVDTAGSEVRLHTGDRVGNDRNDRFGMELTSPSRRAPLSCRRNELTLMQERKIADDDQFIGRILCPAFQYAEVRRLRAITGAGHDHTKRFGHGATLLPCGVRVQCSLCPGFRPGISDRWTQEKCTSIRFTTNFSKHRISPTRWCANRFRIRSMHGFRAAARRCASDSVSRRAGTRFIPRLSANISTDWSRTFMQSPKRFTPSCRKAVKPSRSWSTRTSAPEDCRAIRGSTRSSTRPMRK